MRNLCLAFLIALLPAASWIEAAGPGVAAPASQPAGSAPTVVQAVQAATPESSKVETAVPAAETAETEAAETDTAAAATAKDSAAAPAAPASLAIGAQGGDASAKPASRAVFQDYTLVAQQYAFGVVAHAVAGALGFFIGSGIETALVGEEEAHQGTLSFTGIRYDNFSGAFWGASIGSFAGSSLAVYFTGQSNEEDGSYFWTLFGTALAGSGALYLADLMGVEDEVDWKPFIPLLALPSAGGVIGFSVSRWFSDRKRESVMGPDAGILVHPPRLSLAMTPQGERLQFQALNLSF